MIIIVSGEAPLPLDILSGSLEHCIEELQPSSCHCGDFSSLYRTIDGVCNNKEEITQGARNVRLRRFVGTSCCYLFPFFMDLQSLNPLSLEPHFFNTTWRKTCLKSCRTPIMEFFRKAI